MAVAAVWLIAAVPAVAVAQTAAESRPMRRLEVSGAAGIVGGADAGVSDANLRANSLEARPFRLFATESRWAAAPAVEARVGVSLTRRYTVEGNFAFARPELRATLSSDAEGAPDLEIAESVDRYFIDASLIVMLEELRFGPVVPTVGGGAGYVRQLHEGRTLVEQGLSLHGAAGARYWMTTRPRGLVRAFGLRADVRLVVIDEDLAAADEPTPHAALSAGVIVVF